MNAFESLGRHLPLFAEARGDIQVSFEFFPPKTEKMEQNLWESIKTLEPLQPRFVSVTYGAGGSTREPAHATAQRILQEDGLTPAHHLHTLHLITHDVNMDAALDTLLASAVAGFYDPKTKALVVRGGEATPYVRSV